MKKEKKQQKNNKQIYLFLTISILFTALIGVLLPSVLNGTFEQDIAVRYTNPLDFTYPIDKLEVSDEGITTVVDIVETAELTMIDSLTFAPGEEILGFEQVPATSKVKYQLASSNHGWTYYNGTSWIPTKNCEGTCANSSEEVNANISQFPIDSGHLILNLLLMPGYQDEEPLQQTLLKVQSPNGIIERTAPRRGGVSSVLGDSIGNWIARDDSISTLKNQSGSVDVLANDADPRSLMDSSSLRVVSAPSNGGTSVNTANGKITYSPNADYVGGDVFRYEVCEEDPFETCLACDGRMTTISFEYIGGSSSQVQVEAKVNGEDTIIFDQQVAPGQQFTIIGTDNRGTLGSTVIMIIDGEEEVSIHTSCSVELHQGDIYGSFEILSGESKNGGPICPVDGPICKQANVNIVVNEWQPLVPKLECVGPRINGVYTALFGYNNRNSTTLNVPIGANNKYSPTPQNRGQGTSFIAGRQTNTHSVDFDGSNLTWSLTGPDGITRSIVASNDPALRCPIELADIVLDDPNTPYCKVASHDVNIAGAVTLSPGYDAFLRLSWEIVAPADMATGVQYVDWGTVSNGDRFNIDVEWPGIRYSDSSVRIRTGAILLDSNTRSPIMAGEKQVDYFWTPQVCPAPEPVIPLLECVEVNRVDESYTAHFGYINPNNKSVTVGIGPDNTFSPAPQNQGQPTNFSSGRSPLYPNSSFTIDFDGSQIAWELNGTTVLAHQNSIDCNQPPVAEDDSEITFQDVPVDINILINDYDPEGALDENSTQLLTQGSNGTVTLNPTTHIATYTPNPGYTGSDSFTYRVCDIVGKCDDAFVNVSILPHDNFPPVAEDDFGITGFETPIDISIPDNDSDPDDVVHTNLITVITPTSNGVAVYNPITGIVTYTPDDGFSGIDQLTYRLCDVLDACDLAVVTIEVLPVTNLPPVAVNDFRTLRCGDSIVVNQLVNDSDPDGFLVASSVEVLIPPTLGAFTIDTGDTGFVTYTSNDLCDGEDKQDEFEYEVCDNDGACTTATVFLTITDDPLVPPPENPNPEIEVAIILDRGQCGGRVYQTASPDFAGRLRIDNARVLGVEYSINGQASWNTATNGARFRTVSGGRFRIDLRELAAGDYSMILRAFGPNNEVGLTTVSCNFTIAPGLIFGANQFIVNNQYSPMDENGVIRFTINQPQTFFLEASGAASAHVIEIDTEEEFELTYDETLKLWTGQIEFKTPGLHRLAGWIGNKNGSYQREINSAFAGVPVEVSDEQGNPIQDATFTVFKRDPDTDSFTLWDGASIAATNPFQVTGDISLILPEGEYFFEAAADGYITSTSRITQISEQSLVSIFVEMTPVFSVFDQLLGNLNAQEGNFQLIITAISSSPTLPIGQRPPALEVFTETGSTINLLDELLGSPTIIMVYSQWNTQAQEQLEIFSTLSRVLGNQYRFVAISTLEPEEIGFGLAQRGAYGFESYKPTEDFHDKYKISSLPIIMMLDFDNKVQRIEVGNTSYDELAREITETFQ